MILLIVVQHLVIKHYNWLNILDKKFVKKFLLLNWNKKGLKCYKTECNFTDLRMLLNPCTKIFYLQIKIYLNLKKFKSFKLTLLVLEAEWKILFLSTTKMTNKIRKKNLMIWDHYRKKFIKNKAKKLKIISKNVPLTNFKFYSNASNSPLQNLSFILLAQSIVKKMSKLYKISLKTKTCFRCIKYLLIILFLEDSKIILALFPIKLLELILLKLIMMDFLLQCL